MKKKKTNKIGRYLAVGASVLALISVISMFFDAVTANVDLGFLGKYSFTYGGILSTFGGSVDYTSAFGATIANAIKNYLDPKTVFNTWSVVGYGLSLVAAILAILFRKKKILLVVPAILLVASAVLIFIEPTLFMSANGIEQSDTVSYALAYGPIIGGCASAASAVLLGGAILIK